MKALVLTAYNRLEHRDAPEPEVAPGEVLVEVRACGICGSDVHGLDGSTGRRIPPVIMGHEASGVIAAVGPNGREVGSAASGLGADGLRADGLRADAWRPGDRVTFDSMIHCGECWHCRRGETNLCDARRVLGVSCDEYRRDGAFADYVSVPRRILCRVPDGVSFAQAAMAEPLSVAVHAVRLAQPSVGESAVVIGAGMIGLLILQVLKASGCSPIISLDIDAGKRERARAMGADLVLDPASPTAAKEILDRTGGRGADAAFEAVGVSAALQSAAGALRKGGRLVLVGNITPKVELPLQLVVTRQIALLGSCANQGEFATCLDLLAAGRVRVDALISARAPLKDGASWFARLRERDSPLLKVILEPGAEKGRAP